MRQTGQEACLGPLVRSVALNTQGKGDLRIAPRVKCGNKGKSEEKYCEGLDPAHGWHGNGIALCQARLDGSRLMNGLLGRIVLRQAAMHHPAEDGQHNDKQTDGEPTPNRTPAGVYPGTRLPRCLVVVHVRLQSHPLFRCGSAGHCWCGFRHNKVRATARL